MIASSKMMRLAPLIIYVFKRCSSILDVVLGYGWKDLELEVKSNPSVKKVGTILVKATEMIDPGIR